MGNLYWAVASATTAMDLPIGGLTATPQILIIKGEK